MRSILHHRYLTAFLMAICLYGLIDLSRAAAVTKSTTNDFLIEVKVKSQYDWLYSSGRFQASGAISDRGTAYATGIVGVDLDLYGKNGRIKVDFISDGVFVIFDATGDYADLIGVTGIYTGESDVRPNGDIITYIVLTGSVSP
jgi:hypothetical protein